MSEFPLSRRRWLGGVATSFLATPALSQPSWPDRSIRVLVGYPAGGANDLVARAIAAPLSDALGQPVVVENRTGAAGGIAAEAAARATPDGYTLYMISSAQVLAPSIRRSVPFDPVRDFTYISLGARAPYFLAVHPSLGVNTVGELVALAKARPGAISFASSGVGAGPHLTMSYFMSVAGIELDHVPYRGDADAMIDLVAGRVPVSFISVAPTVPHVQAGRLKALAVSGAERVSVAPEVPTVAESGYPGFAMDAWWGLAGPAGLPASVVNRIAREVRPILDAPSFAERFAASGVVPSKVGPAEFTQLVRDDRVRFDRIVETARIPVQD
ncbi:tripartite tricarboxylate transporter substrate binding protein [Roseomonas terrae]|jgi:tripartite-type tricarboxylate transporter receptor subunit TctC|uniref:Tripartite tricarboxylate transporter substrate binding protein n=1 Tax=Neoroseomonas terrae TaxID=424799 RepID=A0ABS5EGF2_9PROT|nr:tripartite tricarboxylate transporter substrate binding protein [Neoroseomonas terrae]MBR0650104.1 tripartite tricarboxylate transporter substrate binding protein [Neoroseomonas terrae]